MNLSTAWQLLVVKGRQVGRNSACPRSGGDVVAQAAIDIARHIGARIIGTASSSKHAFLKERGLHEAIDYRTGDSSVGLARLTDGGGVELVIDPLGGKHWRKSFKAPRSTGRLGMFGISAATASKLFSSSPDIARGPGDARFHPIPLVNQE